jgi:hypothetical protein
MVVITRLLLVLVAILRGVDGILGKDRVDLADRLGETLFDTHRQDETSGGP